MGCEESKPDRLSNFSDIDALTEFMKKEHFKSEYFPRMFSHSIHIQNYKQFPRIHIRNIKYYKKLHLGDDPQVNRSLSQIFKIFQKIKYCKEF
mmetsp:Transcript_36798/g.33026  ORF Transcript_36798/g.33026 Transcript_36798/m.33026 type:complete len:93 (-) Transcript_36798:338-616(-)